ncbi:MAG: queuosine salvage family protein [Chloroflexota bacterium]|nr:queuosine salvage family protein [Chloroflexota bacterium]
MLDFEMARDPLRVLETTRLVVEAARSVTIDRDKVEEVAGRLAGAPDPVADWNHDLHPPARDAAELANLVLVLDALNFCFWNIPGTGRERWRVTYAGQEYDGYWALAAALRRAVEAGMPLADAEYLVALSEDDMATILAGDPGCDDIPLLHARLEHLREAGKTLLSRWDGQFLEAITEANGSAAKLVREVLAGLPSFRDSAPWNGHDIRFHKRAQILIADLSGAFNGEGAGCFHDLHTLTAFADYKVPQVLRQHGILTYAPALAGAIANHRLIPPDSDEELEIRASTIWAVELLRQSLAGRSKEMPAYAIDWALWQSGQSLPATSEPYHRTLTIFY